MTATTSTSTAPGAGTRVPGPAPLSATVGITTGGTIYWLAIVWAIALALLLVALAIQGWRDIQVDNSVWQGLGAGWQRWLALAAGWTMVPSFAPMLISNGVTRARLSTSATITMGFVGALGALVVVLGFALEDLVFGWADWSQQLDDGSAAGGVRFAAEVWLETALGLAAYFGSGWLIGACYVRFGKDTAWVLILPSLLPVVAAELLLRSRTGAFGLGFLARALDDLGQPSAAIGVPLTLVVLAATCAVARAVTRTITLRC